MLYYQFNIAKVWNTDNSALKYETVTPKPHKLCSYWFLKVLGKWKCEKNVKYLVTFKYKIFI